MLKSKQPAAMISVSASPELRAWLKMKAEESYRSMSAQAALLLNAAMAAEVERREVVHDGQA